MWYFKKLKFFFRKNVVKLGGISTANLKYKFENKICSNKMRLN